jgi:enoyl-CoA hydratase
MMDYSAYRSLSLNKSGDGIAEIVMGQGGRLPVADAAGHDELGRIWLDIDRDPDIRVVIVRGQEKGFSGGGALDLVEEMGQDFKARARVWKEARAIVMNMIECSKVIITPG